MEFREKQSYCRSAVLRTPGHAPPGLRRARVRYPTTLALSAVPYRLAAVEVYWNALESPWIDGELLIVMCHVCIVIVSQFEKGDGLTTSIDPLLVNGV